MSLSVLRRRRDMLVRLFEQNWPEIEPFCGPNPEMPGFIRLLHRLVQAAPESQISEASQRLIGNRFALENFLTSPALKARFRGDPRALVGALAGVPEIDLWRSLKLCPPSTCRIELGLRAARSYLRRKHPELHRALESRMDLIQTVAWLKNYRSRDKWFRSQTASEVHRLWHRSD